jgi:DNA-binding HxlR family transcriptional regulator
MTPEEESPICRHYRVASAMLGKRWTPQILRGLLSGVTRYTDLKDGVAPISDALLSDRLKELEILGIVVREVTPSTPVRITYGLTEKGQDLAGVIEELAAWAERWAEEPASA